MFGRRVSPKPDSIYEDGAHVRCICSPATFAVNIKRISTMSENEILTSIRNGNQQQLASVYEKYRSEFLHWMTREFHCSPEDSKDIYQFTILIFYDNVKSGYFCVFSCFKMTFDCLIVGDLF